MVCLQGRNIETKSYMQGKIMIHDKIMINLHQISVFKNKLEISSAEKFQLCRFKAVKTWNIKRIEYLQKESIKTENSTPKKWRKSSLKKMFKTQQQDLHTFSIFYQAKGPNFASNFHWQKLAETNVAPINSNLI